MRCVDLIRELSTPTGALEPSAIGEHLARCAECAAWAGRDARLTRAWEATRPPVLSDQAWDQIWAKVSEGRETAAPLALVGQADSAPASRKISRPGRWTLAFVLAQAAALLIASVVLLGRGQAAPLRQVEIEQEQIVIIPLDGKRQLRDVALNDDPNGLTPDYAMLNYFESIAE